MNTLRITARTASETLTLHTESIHTGSHPGARIVSRAAVSAALVPGAQVEVLTARGWQPRRIVRAGKLFVTRVAA